MIRSARWKYTSRMLVACAWVAGTTVSVGTWYGTIHDRTDRDASPYPLAIAQRETGLVAGLFQYMADAAMITLCTKVRRLPVATEAGYNALETAYSRARHELGDAMLGEVEGTVEPRPSAAAGTIPQVIFVVQRFIDIRPHETCRIAMTDSPLRNIYWKLVRLSGAPVEVAERQREPHLIFALHQMRVSGSGGCNRIAGTFELDDDRLRLRRLASTRMACSRGMEQEDRFLRALGTVEHYRISGHSLDLLDAAGTAVAQFEAVTLH